MCRNSTSTYIIYIYPFRFVARFSSRNGAFWVSSVWGNFLVYSAGTVSGALVLVWMRRVVFARVPGESKKGESKKKKKCGPFAQYRRDAARVFPRDKKTAPTYSARLSLSHPKCIHTRKLSLLCVVVALRRVRVDNAASKAVPHGLLARSVNVIG